MEEREKKKESENDIVQVFPSFQLNNQEKMIN